MEPTTYKNNDNNTDMECPICYNSLAPPVVQMCTNKHNICGTCFLALAAKSSGVITCPLCRLMALEITES